MNPSELNYKMPAEWQPHERTFLSWPVRASMCHPEDYARVCRGYADFANAISEFEPVTLLANPGDQEIIEELMNPINEAIDFRYVPHNDSWLRDNGPTFLKNQYAQLAGVNWRFNAWGEKYKPWDLDDAAAPTLLDQLHVQRLDAPLVMEGGSFHVDGEGSLLTTEQCLLNPNRNPDMNRGQIEEKLRSYLNIDKVIWLKDGLSGDETDGHVDNIACFATPGKVLIQSCDDPADDNFSITEENIARLEQAVDAKGRKLKIIRVPQPPKRYYQGSRLTLSYLNFYFVNHGVILPVFGGDAEETDKQASDILAKLFPDRRIRTVDGMAIIREGGNIHCATQQMPVQTEKRSQMS
ncbi:agmatine deiminase family protein [Sporolactobacillus sp. STCC-11]|uniref:agmatine deiminase family protein n=1 Tax=Sporolactobacillus caesalpiniae TaxID=3230362 RepID=UPI0033932B20